MILKKKQKVAEKQAAEQNRDIDGVMLDAMENFKQAWHKTKQSFPNSVQKCEQNWNHHQYWTDNHEQIFEILCESNRRRQIHSIKIH